MVAKRSLDVLGSLVGLILLSPVMLVVAVLVRIFHGSPVFFTQARAGKNGVAFNMIKFRSMSNKKDHNGELLPDSLRLTKFGRLLRATSLDELPELVNILRGEMSLVGPRPLLLRYVERYSPFQRRRLEVLPGLTGWAQVNGRNALSWDDRFSLDIWYVDHATMLLDLKIIFMTVGKVFMRSGISQDGQATMEEFVGTPPHQP
jgi:sugar transferase EpsL